MVLKKEVKKIKVDNHFDINQDGKIDRKDASLAGKVLSVFKKKVEDVPIKIETAAIQPQVVITQPPAESVIVPELPKPASAEISIDGKRCRKCSKIMIKRIKGYSVEYTCEDCNIHECVM